MVIIKIIIRAISLIIKMIKSYSQANKIKKMGSASLLALDDDDFYEAIECYCDGAIMDVTDEDLTIEQRYIYSLYMFELEVNNGGLCQFFVNSSRECAPYISEALGAIGANSLKSLFDNFIEDNGIDVNDLTSFEISDIDEYEAQTQRFDFDSFDDKFYEDENFHQLIIDYARKNIDNIVK